MSTIGWPPHWQAEAIDAILPFVDADVRVEIVIDDPKVSIDGSILAGYLYATDDGEPMMIYDRTQRQDLYPWRLLPGPVLHVTVRADGRRRRVVYTHPEWTPRLA